MRGNRASLWRATALVALVTLALSACSSAPRDTRLLPGTQARLAWTGTYTTANPASQAASTPGNGDIAAMTRGAFATLDASGEIRPDASFGTASLVGGEKFVVRYDLADGVRWSDGVPIDAADLMLAWVSLSNALSTKDLDVESLRQEDGSLALEGETVWFDARLPGGMQHATEPPKRDDWQRTIEVPLTQAVPDWQTMLQVAVPAHVVGQRAFGVSDPMQAKQRVLDAIDRNDPLALAPIAREWNTGFLVSETSADPSSLLSSAAYRVEALAGGGVQLVANNRYVGEQRAQIERVRLIASASDSDALDAVAAGDIDVASVRPTDEQSIAIRDLERRGATLDRSGSQTRWELVIRTARAPFQTVPARKAFLRLVDRSALIEAALGERASEATTTDSLLFRPGTRLYDDALEDAGFAESLPFADGADAAAIRQGASIPDNTEVCVAYPTRDSASKAMFDELRKQAAAAGWRVTDCGEANLADAQRGKQWTILLRAANLATDVAGIDARWRSGGVAATGSASRDSLLTEALATADQEALESTLIEIETSMVADSFLLPIAERPQLTVSLPAVSGVAPRPGEAPLTWNAWEWGTEQPAAP